MKNRNVTSLHYPVCSIEIHLFSSCQSKEALESPQSGPHHTKRPLFASMYPNIETPPPFSSLQPFDHHNIMVLTGWYQDTLFCINGSQIWATPLLQPLKHHDNIIVLRGPIIPIDPLFSSIDPNLEPSIHPLPTPRSSQNYGTEGFQGAPNSQGRPP